MRHRQRPEPTIALINVVFLMLIFFMVAGTLAPPLDPALRLVDTRALAPRDAPDALVLTAAGAVLYRGAAVADVGAFVSALAPGEAAQIVPDRAAAAADLLALAQRLRAAGAARVVIVTERALR